MLRGGSVGWSEQVRWRCSSPVGWNNHTDTKFEHKCKVIFIPSSYSTMPEGVFIEVLVFVSCVQMTILPLFLINTTPLNYRSEVIFSSSRVQSSCPFVNLRSHFLQRCLRALELECSCRESFRLRKLREVFILHIAPIHSTRPNGDLIHKMKSDTFDKAWYFRRSQLSTKPDTFDEANFQRSLILLTKRRLNRYAIQDCVLRGQVPNKHWKIQLKKNCIERSLCCNFYHLC